MLQTIRWLPKRKVIFVGDSSFGTHELANSMQNPGHLSKKSWALEQEILGT